MNKSKIKSIFQTGTSEWQGKQLRKYAVVLDNEDQGTLTLFPDNQEPKIGEEIEYELQDRGYGPEIKLKKSGGGGGGRAPRNPRIDAMIPASGIVKSMIDKGLYKTPVEIENGLMYWTNYLMHVIDQNNPKPDSLPF